MLTKSLKLLYVIGTFKLFFEKSSSLVNEGFFSNGEIVDDSLKVLMHMQLYMTRQQLLTNTE